jgi:hypothetical protein
MTALGELLNKAVSELDNMESGERFLVRDLFKGYEWNRIADGDKKTLGRMFLYEYEKGAVAVNKLEKNLQRQQWYSKK